MVVDGTMITLAYSSNAFIKTFTAVYWDGDTYGKECIGALRKGMQR